MQPDVTGPTVSASGPLAAPMARPRLAVSPRVLSTAALLALLVIALALRLYGIDWDQGGLFHPDERAVLMNTNDLRWPAPSEVGSLLDAQESPLNPGWFNYGSLPMYLLKAVQSVGSSLPRFDLGPLAFDGTLDLFDIRIHGRVISALADTATVALVFLIAGRWYGRRVGFVAAALSALSVIQIQLAHFYAFDGLMTAFIVAAVFFSMRVAFNGKPADSALAGLMFGLGMATKFAVAPLALTLLVAHATYALSRPGDVLDLRRAAAAEAARRQWQAYRGLLIAAGVAVAAMLVAQPYMLLDFTTFSANVGEQSQMVRRILDYPYTRQYVDTPKFWYQAWQLGIWGLGPALGVVALVGFAGGLAVALVTKRKADFVILSWLLPYLLITGWFDVKFMRYMLPAAPFLLLYSARLLVWSGGAFTTLWPRRRWLAYAPALVVIALTAHYALAFESIYRDLHPAQDVSEWLRQNAQPGAAVLQEHWEEGIPNVPGLVYPERLGLYEPDTPEKFDRIALELARADYLVLYSNRLYGTLPRLEGRYPLSTGYYADLFAGRLGYEMAYVAQKERSFLGVAYADDPFARIDNKVQPPASWQAPAGRLATLRLGWSDESFTVYEHPVVFVFENRDRLSEADILIAIGGTEVTGRPAISPRTLGLQLTPGAAAVQQAGGTWTDIAFQRSLPDRYSWLVWLLAAQVMAFVSLPLAFTLFRPLPDRGYLLAKPFGILLAATATWWLASLGWVKFSAASVAIGIFVVAAASVVAWRFNGAELRAFIRERWRFVLFAEALFAAAFLAFVAVRAANPDLWHPFRGGEKPMDFAYLNAVVRSSVMPPYDPWFAGGYLNYYYFGQFIVAALIRLTGIEPAVAYNLAPPLLFALTVAGAFSIVYNLAELTQRARGLPPGSSRSPVYAGIAAALLVAVAGNIDGLVQVWETYVVSDGPGRGFDFWRSSRMMSPGSQGFEITEFPFFTFLFADLHAHLVAIPFALLALGLMVSAFIGAGRSRPRLERWGGLAAIGVVTGALRTINTWDFPTALVLAVLLVGGGELLDARGRPWRAVAMAVGKVVFIVLVGHIAYLPFHSSFELFNNGVVKSETVTEPWRYVAIHSVFFTALLGWAVFEWRAAGLTAAWAGLRGRAERYGLGGNGLAAVAVIFATLLLAFAVTGYGTVALAIMLAAGLLVTVAVAAPASGGRARYMLPVAAMAAVALVIGAAVDLFTVKGDIGRMNTVFKFYLHAWVLFALAAAYVLWLLGIHGKLSLRRLSLPRGVWLAALAVLAAGVMVYPVLGTRARIRDRFNLNGVGLDGMAYMQDAVQWEKGAPIPLKNDLETIRWLQENVRGSPVIIEGLTDLYHWGNRFSVYTGLPAVIGWDWHQRQQRVDYDWAVTERRQEIDRFYRSPSEIEAAATLDRYGVKYVVVGDLERVMYPPEGIAKFGQMEDRGLRPAWSNGAVTIYEYTPGSG